MDHTRKIHDTLFILNKIITYKAAAAILNVSVNEAKTILKQYLKDKKDDKLNVSYVVGGITKDNSHKITIVPDLKYDKVKLSFKTITIDHVYSIQNTTLTDWVHVFNVDDLLYDKETKITAESVNIVKEEPESPIKKEPISPAKNKKTSQATNKKGGISNFFSQSQAKPAVKKESSENEPKQKTAKTNALFSFVSKNKTSNKENTSKTINKLSPKKEVINVTDDDEEVVKSTKKRTRAILIDDDEEEEVDTPSKCQKVDILDDIVESDEDIFGAQEKEDAVNEDAVKEDAVKEDAVKEDKKIEINDVEDDTPCETKSDETDDVMYEDDDGYFVTETKPGLKKTPKKSPEKKKDPVVEKAEKKSKKEIMQKIKKNTSQNTLLTYFQKK